MKLKYIFVTLVINIFLMMTVTLLQEFLGIKETFKKLDNTFDLAVDSAVYNSMASEEFFSDEFDDALASKSHSYRDSDKFLYSTTKYMRRAQWIDGNSYILAMYYKEKGVLPQSQYAYNSYANGKTTEDIYKFLFGGTGSDYDNVMLSWANPWQESGYAYDANSRNPTSDFKAFYDNVGKQIISHDYMVKHKTADSDGSFTFSLEERDVPTLTQMGLQLDNYNRIYSSFTADNFTSVTHSGKYTNVATAGGSDYQNSIYYLTPYSLGVTYIPKDVLNSNLRADLENLIRFSKCKASPTTKSTAAINVIYNSANGCIDTSIYDDGHGGASVDPETHTPAVGSEIYNDGDVEYDMSTLQSKVDYFVVDFYDNANWKIVNEIEGATPGDKAALATLPSRLKDTDTTEGGSGDGKRIVAKVTAKVKVHIPYKSPILQWFVKQTASAGEEHYGVARWSNASNNIVEDDDGLWYVYTTYTSVSR